MSVNIKNNVEKDTTLLMFFFLKSGRPCNFFSNKTLSYTSVAYMLIELFYIGMPPVRTDSRAVGRSVYGHVITTYSYPWFGNSGEIGDEKHVFFSFNLFSNIRL